MKIKLLFTIILISILKIKAQPCLIKFDSLRLKTANSTCNYKEFEYFLSNTNNHRFYWDYGDGNNCTCIKPKNFYTKNGNYTIMGIVYDANNCADTIKMQVNVNCSNPCDLSQIGIISADTLSYSCNEIEFNMRTSNNTKKSTWFFGDGNTSNDAFYVHAYTANGLYKAKGIVEDSIGCKDSVEFDINIDCDFTEPCNFKISKIDTSWHSDCLKKNISLATNKTPKEVYYKINQGSFFVGNVVQTIAFPDTGIHTLCAIAIDSSDCADTLCTFVKIKCPQNNSNISNFSKHTFKIYPNPAQDILKIETTESLLFEILDINGKIIMLKEIKNDEEISLQNLKTGIYLVRINGMVYSKVLR